LQAIVGSYPQHAGRALELRAFTVGAPTRLRRVEIWRIEPTNEGFHEAASSRVWQPEHA
jgi:hypothetical protein